MCGRFTLRSIPVLAQLFDLAEVPELVPHYNIAPTQAVAAVRVAAERERKELVLFRWGLIPSWAVDPKIGNRLINARAETAAEKPSFRSAFRHRRCLVLADGFYEWKRSDGHKDPFYFRLRQWHLFAFAGLWERWQTEGGQAIESCTLLTTEANSVVRPVHERMPVILQQADYQAWLDPEVKDPAKIQPLLRPYPEDEMEAYPISPWVNNPKHDDPRCVQPVT